MQRSHFVLFPALALAFGLFTPALAQGPVDTRLDVRPTQVQRANIEPVQERINIRETVRDRIEGQTGDVTEEVRETTNRVQERTREMVRELHADIETRQAALQDAVSAEERREIIAEFRTAHRERIQTFTQEIRERAQANRKEIPEEARDRVQNAVQRVIGKMQNALTRLERHIERLDTRLTELAESGADVSDADAKLVEALDAVLVAQDILDGLAERAEAALANEDDATAQDTFAAIRAELAEARTAIGNAHESFRAALALASDDEDEVEEEEEANADASE